MRYFEADGLSSPEACEVLARLAAAVPAEQAIVELGVYRGRSLMALAEGSLAGNGAWVYGIDPFNLPRPSKPKYSSDETYRAALDNCQNSVASDLITLHKDFGVNIARDWPDTRKVGLLYVDSDHRKVPVLNDFAQWRPHMLPGSVIAWDDHDKITFPGVVEAVNCLWQQKKVTRPQLMTDRLAVSIVL